MRDYKPTRDANGVLRRGKDGPPLITPPGGDKPVSYQRISHYTSLIEDQYNIQEWGKKVVALGLARDPSALDQLAVAAAAVADPMRHESTKDTVADLVGRAFIAGGGKAASEAGTAMHTLTEMLDRGEEPEDVPPAFQGPLEAYRWSTAGLEMLAIEQFVVVDELRAAGTLDRLVRLPDGRVVVADLKTGSTVVKFPNGTAGQIALYAHGQRYDPVTEERSELHPDLDQTTGLLIHCPLTPNADGSYACDCYLLDLTLGWERVLKTAEVRALKNHPKPKKLEIA
ncbi:MAG: hypothetical protein NVSMB4_09960 [Acidimicrobiales bacterium]